MQKTVVGGQLTIMSVAQHYLNSVCKRLGVQKTNTAHPHKEKQQMSHLKPCQFVLSVSGSVHLLVNMAPTQRRVLLKERGND